jgi:hypothetical protein
MASCPVCSRRLPAHSVSSELTCRACGARLKSNPYSAGLLALALGGSLGGILMSVDHSWPWFVMGLVAFVVVSCALWRDLFKAEQRSPPENFMRDSGTTGRAPTPWHLWAIGIIALVWSALGAMDYVMTHMGNEVRMRDFNLEQLEYFYEIPAWVVAAWAIGVWGGVLGALLLLFRRHVATWFFLVSLLAIVVTTSYHYLLADAMEVLGDDASLALTSVRFLFALGLFLYARAMRRRGVLA